MKSKKERERERICICNYTCILVIISRSFPHLIRDRHDPFYVVSSAIIHNTITAIKRYTRDKKKTQQQQRNCDSQRNNEQKLSEKKP